MAPSCTLPLVLVIEDDEDLQNLLLLNLRRAGFVALGARTAGEGLALASRHRPSVVLLDRMLPGIDGLALCRTLHDDPELGKTPVMLLTALGTDEDRRAGRLAGAEAYVSKPFAVGDLLERVRALTLVAHARRARDSARPPAGGVSG